jgi:hypothetical protein
MKPCAGWQTRDSRESLGHVDLPALLADPAINDKVVNAVLDRRARLELVRLAEEELAAGGGEPATNESAAEKDDSATTQAVPPRLVMGENQWLVKKILKHRVVRNMLEFKVWWDGYSESEATWQSEKDLNAGGRNTLLANYVQV